MPLSEVERRTLWLTVWHSDMFGRNDFLGEVMLPMQGQIFDDPAPKWYSLQDRVSKVEFVRWRPWCIHALVYTRSFSD